MWNCFNCNRADGGGQTQVFTMSTQSRNVTLLRKVEMECTHRLRHGN
jgi:hypothetical protein